MNRSSWRIIHYRPIHVSTSIQNDVRRRSLASSSSSSSSSWCLSSSLASSLGKIPRVSRMSSRICASGGDERLDDPFGADDGNTGVECARNDAAAAADVAGRLVGDDGVDAEERLGRQGGVGGDEDDARSARAAQNRNPCRIERRLLLRERRKI